MASSQVDKVRHSLAQNTSIEFHRQLKSSLLLEDSMPDLLSSAPLAYYFMGQIRLLQYSNAAQTVKLGKRQKNDLLEYSNLPSNLNLLVTQGITAFEKADANMKRLGRLSVEMFGSNGMHDAIIRYLENPKIAKKRLEPAITTLKNELAKCVRLVTEIKTEFNIWNSMANELGQSVTIQTSVAWDKGIQIQGEVSEVRETQEVEREESASLRKEVSDAHLDVQSAKKAFEKASKRNGAWNNLGLAVVAELSNQTLSAVSGVVDIVNAAPNLAAEAIRAPGNFRPFSSGDTGIQQNSLLSSEEPVLQERRQTFRNANDLAYAKAAEIHALISDFSKACGADLKNAVKDQDGSLAQCISDIKDCLKSLESSNTAPSIEARQILDECIRIGNEIKSHFGGTTNGNGGSTQRKQVEANLRSRIKLVSDKSAGFMAKASAQPGQAFGADMPILTRLSKSAKERPIDTQALLARKQQHLLTMMQHHESMKINYQAKQRSLAKNQSNIIKLTHRMKRLEASTATTEELRTVILQASRCVQQLLGEIIVLERYFTNIHSVIEDIGNIRCQRFLAEVEAGVDRKQEVWGISYSNWEAQSIYSSILTLRGHFAVVCANAEFYRKVSHDYLLPAMKEVCGMPIDESKEIQRDAGEKLQKSTQEACEKIKEIGKQRYEELLTQTMDDAKRMEDELAQSPLICDNSRQKAIKDAVRQVQNEAAKGIEDSASVMDYIHPESTGDL